MDLLVQQIVTCGSLQLIDRAENLGILAAVARSILDVRPADYTSRINQKVRAVSVVSVLEEHAVPARHVALEVTQQIDLHVVLCFVLLERIRVVDADWQDRHATTDEL